MEQRKADLPKKQAREKAADRVRRRSADTARQSVTYEFPSYLFLSTLQTSI